MRMKFILKMTVMITVKLRIPVGEWFQDAAVNRAKSSIKALLDVRPNEVTVVRNGKAEMVNPKEVELEEIIRIKPGEKVALDGELVSDKGAFNTAALTGESKPDSKSKGDAVYAGMINLRFHTIERLW